MKKHPDDATVHFGSDYLTPEDLFAIRPGVPRGLHIDALDCVLSRAAAVTQMLAVAHSNLGGPSLNQETIADAIWTVEGLIAEARMISGHCGQELPGNRIPIGELMRQIGLWGDAALQAMSEFESLKTSEQEGEAKPATFSYYIAPSNANLPGPFNWFVVNESTASVEQHGVEASWLEADRAAVVAIKDVEGEQ